MVDEGGCHDAEPRFLINKAGVTRRELVVVTDLRPSKLPPPAWLGSAAQALKATLDAVRHAPTDVQDTSASKASPDLGLVVKVKVAGRRFEYVSEPLGLAGRIPWTQEGANDTSIRVAGARA